MGSMMALRAHQRGGADELVYESAPRPEPDGDDVLVAVHAAAITVAELSWEATWTRADGEDRTPIIPSHEVSGTIVELGSESQAIRDRRRESFGLIDFHRDGAAAEYVTVPEAALALRPVGIPHLESAAIPLAGLTAWQALVEHAHVQSGERVLVLGGAGGVGSFAVQIARVLGARVTATARPADANLVRRLGASSVIDFPTESFPPSQEGFDVLIDAVGGPVRDRSFALLQRPGRATRHALRATVAIACGDAPNQCFILFIVSPDRHNLEQLGDVVGRPKGTLTIP